MSALVAARSMSVGNHCYHCPSTRHSPATVLRLIRPICLRRHGDSAGPLLLYGDVSRVSDGRGSMQPWLKPEWDPRMAWSQDYFSAACAIPVGAALETLRQSGSAPPAFVFESLLRLILGAVDLDVEHVDRISWKRVKVTGARMAQTSLPLSSGFWEPRLTFQQGLSRPSGFGIPCPSPPQVFRSSLQRGTGRIFCGRALKAYWTIPIIPI